MAQDFERTITKDVDATLTDIRATSNSDDAILVLLQHFSFYDCNDFADN